MLIQSEGQIIDTSNNSMYKDYKGHEDMYAIRKEREEGGQGDQPRTRQRIGDPPIIAPPQIQDGHASGVHEPLDEDVTMADSEGVSHNAQNVPMEKPRVHLTSEPLTAKELVNRPVYQVSLAQLADIAPSLRTHAKAALTKPHRTRDQNQTTMLQVEKQDAAIQLPQGESVPRAIGCVNENMVNMILDGGCVPCIISKRLADALELELGPGSTSLIFGDGRGKQSLHVKSPVTISVGPSKSVDVRTLCLDVESYDFVVGREAFAQLAIGTDWGHHFWYVLSPQGNMPLNVQYTPIPRGELVMRPRKAFKDDEVLENDDEPDVGLLLCLESSEDTAERCNDTVEPTSYLMINNDQQDDFGAMLNGVQSRQDLQIEEKNALLSVLMKHKGCFGSSYADVTQTDLVTFHVDTGDARPIYRRPYPHMSHSELARLKEELEAMVSNGILIPAMHARFNSRNGGWGFPCRYVAKKDGGRRLVTQFQDLNKVAIRDPWPLPNIQDLLEQLSGSSVFSTMDLLKGFHQILVDPDSIPKLTIATPFGCYSYRVMPFGVINGPSYFSRAIHLALEPFLHRCATHTLMTLRSIRRQCKTTSLIWMRCFRD